MDLLEDNWLVLVVLIVAWQYAVNGSLFGKRRKK